MIIQTCTHTNANDLIIAVVKVYFDLICIIDYIITVIYQSIDNI